jgi:hypothetical protein
MALVADPDGGRLYQVTRELATVVPFAIGPEGGLSPIAEPVDIVTGAEAFPGGVAYLDGGVRRVAIDVRPWSPRNPIPVRGRRPIPVAILGDDGFDVADVLFASVRFGPAAAPPAGPPPGEPRDIDGDGHPDLLLLFGIRASGFDCGDSVAVLTGSTIDGRDFRGRDAVRVVGCGQAAFR